MIESGIPIGQRPQNHAGIMGNNQQPWLPIDSIIFLEENLSLHHVGFEFGAGSSTFWFSKITKNIHSIESDENWFQSIISLISSNSIENIDIHCIPCLMSSVWSVDTEINDNYIKYANYILNFDFKFDYIIVDGVARSLCIKNAINKVKPGGFLVIDNAEKPAYQDAIAKIPEEWILYEFKNDLDLTLIFQNNQ